MSRAPDPFSFPLTRIDAVAHVGSLDAGLRGVDNRYSLEAFCLSVSVDPDAWRGIARCGDAPEWTLARSGAVWLDACSLSDAQETEIIDWAVAEGLAERTTLWRSWRFDDEADDWAYMILPDKASAIDEAEEDWEDGGPDGGTGVEPFEGVRLTAAAMEALERFGPVPRDGGPGDPLRRPGPGAGACRPCRGLAGRDRRPALAQLRARRGATVPAPAPRDTRGLASR